LVSRPPCRLLVGAGAVSCFYQMGLFLLHRGGLSAVLIYNTFRRSSSKHRESYAAGSRLRRGQVLWLCCLAVFSSLGTWVLSSGVSGTGLTVLLSGFLAEAAPGLDLGIRAQKRRGGFVITSWQPVPPPSGSHLTAGALRAAAFVDPACSSWSPADRAGVHSAGWAPFAGMALEVMVAACLPVLSARAGRRAGHPCPGGSTQHPAPG
jgi:hypothetical protein